MAANREADFLASTYLLTYDPALWVVDIKDSIHPRRVGFTALTRIYATERDMPDCDCGAAFSLAADGAGRLYVLTGNVLRVLDVSEPAQPREAEHYVLPGIPLDVAARPGAVYVAATDGLWVLTASDTTATP